MNDCPNCEYHRQRAQRWREEAYKQAGHPLPEREQKPMHPQLKAMLEEYFDKCFAESAPQRTWVGLTDEEIKAFDTWHDNREEEIGWVNPSEIVAYIEAKLKEKNT
jgi:hypothetical protein